MGGFIHLAGPVFTPLDGANARRLTRKAPRMWDWSSSRSKKGLGRGLRKNRVATKPSNYAAWREPSNYAAWRVPKKPFPRG